MGLGIKAWADDFNAMLNETDTTGVSPHNVGPIPVATLEVHVYTCSCFGSLVRNVCISVV